MGRNICKGLDFDITSKWDLPAFPTLNDSEMIYALICFDQVDPFYLQSSGFYFVVVP